MDASSRTLPKALQRKRDTRELRVSCHVTLLSPQLGFQRHVPGHLSTFFGVHATHAPVQVEAAPSRSCCIVAQEETASHCSSGVGWAGVEHHECRRASRALAEDCRSYV